MRFHVVSLPHTQTDGQYPSCAFTNKVIRFAKMMKNLGHTVYLYSGQWNTTPCSEHISLNTEEERRDMLGGKHYTAVEWGHPMFQRFNERAIQALYQRIQKEDFICVIGGYTNKPIADAFPNHRTIEYGIGYPHPFSQWRIYESYSWMHTVMGAESNGQAGAIDGRFFDDVIPNQVDDDLYSLGSGQGDYALYMGRIIDRKGYRIAQDVCEEAGIRLILAGPGEGSGYGEFVGEVDAHRRAVLMENARCLFVPTIYVEPFGTVHIEAMACGTPVITTDWGVFPDTVINGVNGYRCRMRRDFKAALENTQYLDRAHIRNLALSRYSMEVVGKQYQNYFERLSTLNGAGWYAE